MVREGSHTQIAKPTDHSSLVLQPPRTEIISNDGLQWIFIKLMKECSKSRQTINVYDFMEATNRW